MMTTHDCRRRPNIHRWPVHCV